MASRAWVARTTVLAMLAPIASSCNKEDKSDQSIEVKTEAPPAAPITMDIAPEPGSPVKGSLTMTQEGDRATVRVNLEGLQEGKEYEARIRYGDCGVASRYLKGDSQVIGAARGPGTTPSVEGASALQPATNGNHEPGDVVAEIPLEQTGGTAVGDAHLDNKDLGMTEDAYLVITEDEVLRACGNLHHSGMAGATPAAPGAERPADTAKR